MQPPEKSGILKLRDRGILFIGAVPWNPRC